MMNNGGAIVPLVMLLLLTAAAAKQFKVVALGDSFTQGGALPPTASSHVSTGKAG
jgi:hypothetical protein